MTAHAQNHAFVIDDTAQYVVDRYLRLQAIDELPEDSLLVLETTVTMGGDTTLMRRWYQPHGMMRVELFHGGERYDGFITNGDKRHRRYSRRSGSWDATSADDITDLLRGYDFRGPLYRWREKGATLTWNGTTVVDGHTLQVVKVVCPKMFDRYYLFDISTGLLTLIYETDREDDIPTEISPGSSHIEWKILHEYLPVGPALLPSLESFMRSGTLTVLSTTMHLEPRNDELFNKD